MRSAHLFLLLLLLSAGSLPLQAQSYTTIAPSQCVWHPGDDPAWAAPNLDDSAWQSLAHFTLPDQPRFWVRCHADLSALPTLAHPVLSVYHNTAFQVYLNGALLGTNGNPATGFNDAFAWHTFPFDGSRRSAVSASTIAIRSSLRFIPPLSSNPAFQILAGDAPPLREHLASLALAEESNWLATAIGFGVIGIAAFIFLGLYCFDRSRPALLILTFVCLGLSCERILQTLGAMNVAIWGPAFSCLFLLSLIGTHLTAVFAYWLNGRKVPLFYKFVTSYAVLSFVYMLFGLLLPIDAAYGYNRVFFFLANRSIFIWPAPVLSFGLIAAWVPWRTVAPSRRSLAICCFLWSAADLVYFSPLGARFGTSAVAAVFTRAEPRLLELRSIGIITTVIALVVLIFRDQQRTARERAELAGEMHAARAVQQVIVPEAIPSVPGFNLESAYKPAGEVGGDFFQVIATPDRGILAVIGDVSGKGMPAAMTVSLLVGTIRTIAHYTQSPSEILRDMNQRMLGRNHGGFTTCLVVRADRDGKLIIANAGHLAPYVDGEEMKTENGLPLGLAADTNYTESAFTLVPGTTLTLLSDGVVEARNPQGELFGFERTTSISTQPAETIARTAQEFGQEDDITVLSLKFAPAEVLHA